MKIKNFLLSVSPRPLIKFYRKIKKKFAEPVRNYEYYRTLPVEKYKKELSYLFKLAHGRKINFQHVETFSEKLYWLRYYDNTNLKTICADKYLVRGYVKGFCGESFLPKLLGVYQSFDEIDFASLPDKFVIKANHGCGFNIIVNDKSKLDLAKTKNKLTNWLSCNYAYFFFELHYMNIRPCIIIEEFLEGINGDLADYKIHVFNGKPQFIQVIGGRDNNDAHEAFFDTEWNFLSLHNNSYPVYSVIPKRPQNLELMLQVAEKLSFPFAYVRVDLYVLASGNIKFGELTFSPGGGNAVWSPPEWEQKLGRLLILPKQKNIIWEHELL